MMTNADGDVGKGETSFMLMEVQTGTATTEISMEVYQKAKNHYTTPYHIPKGPHTLKK